MKRGRIEVETEVIMIGFDIVVNKVYSLWEKFFYKEGGE